MNKFAGFACALVFSTPCLAQVVPGRTTVTTTTTTAAPAPARTSLRASQLMGTTVHLQGTNDYGKVEDIILSDDGGPTYLLVANNGQYVMMPLNAATFDETQKSLTYDVAPQAVQPLLFKQGAYPNIADPTYTSRLNQTFPNAEKIKIKQRANGTIKEKIKNP